MVAFCERTNTRLLTASNMSCVNSSLDQEGWLPPLVDLVHVRELHGLAVVTKVSHGRLQYGRLVHLVVAFRHQRVQLVDQHVEVIPPFFLAQIAGLPRFGRVLIAVVALLVHLAEILCEHKESN